MPYIFIITQRFHGMLSVLLIKTINTKKTHKSYTRFFFSFLVMLQFINENIKQWFGRISFFLKGSFGEITRGLQLEIKPTDLELRTQQPQGRTLNQTPCAIISEMNGLNFIYLYVLLLVNGPDEMDEYFLIREICYRRILLISSFKLDKPRRLLRAIQFFF